MTHAHCDRASAGRPHAPPPFSLRKVLAGGAPESRSAVAPPRELIVHAEDASGVRAEAAICARCSRSVLALWHFATPGLAPGDAPGTRLSAAHCMIAFGTDEPPPTPFQQHRTHANPIISVRPPTTDTAPPADAAPDPASARRPTLAPRWGWGVVRRTCTSVRTRSVRVSGGGQSVRGFRSRADVVGVGGSVGRSSDLRRVLANDDDRSALARAVVADPRPTLAHVAPPTSFKVLRATCDIRGGGTCVGSLFLQPLRPF
ncbi:hypothetical protein VTO73DRAFT_14000 [Trametes versicolor]